MDFNLTEEQKEFRKNVGNFAREELVPRVREIDDKGGFSHEIWSKLVSIGLPGLPAPEAYGGAGVDSLLTQTVLVEELARHDFSSAANIVSSWSIVNILSTANEEQKQKYLVPVCSGETVGAFAQTEPNSGSDVASMKTTARLENGQYLLNGEKCFITQAGEGDFTIVIARTSDAPGSKGMSALIVDKDAPGFIIGKKEDKLGYRGSTTCSIAFDDCRIPAANLIGEEGKGFKQAMKMLTGGRVLTAAQALGQAQAALDASVEYAKERKQFGRSIGNFQLIQGMIADMAIKLESARLLTYKAAWLKDNGQPFMQEASMAKTLATDVAMEAAVDAVQIYGGYGYMRDYPVESIMRNVKITQIFEGTNEIQRLIIARNLLDEKESFREMYGKVNA